MCIFHTCQLGLAAFSGPEHRLSGSSRPSFHCLTFLSETFSHHQSPGGLAEGTQWSEGSSILTRNATLNDPAEVKAHRRTLQPDTCSLLLSWAQLLAHLCADSVRGQWWAEPVSIHLEGWERVVLCLACMSTTEKERFPEGRSSYCCKDLTFLF